MVLNKSVFKSFLNALNSKDINWIEFIHVVKYLISVVFKRGLYIPRIKHSLFLKEKKVKYYKTVFKVLAEYTSGTKLGIVAISENRVLIRQVDVKDDADRISKFIGTGMMALNSVSLIPKMEGINITYNNDLQMARFYLKDREGASEFIFNDFKIKELIPIKNKVSEQVIDIFDYPLHIDFHSHIRRIINYNLLQGVNIVYYSSNYKKTLAYRFSLAAKQLNRIFKADVNTFIDWDSFLMKTYDNIILNETKEKEMIRVKVRDIVPMDIVEASISVIELNKLDATIELEANIYNVLTSKVVEIKQTSPENKNAIVHSFESFVPYLNSFLKTAKLAITEDSIPAMAGADISRIFTLDLRRGL